MKNIVKRIGLMAITGLCLTGCISQQQITMQSSQAAALQNSGGAGRPANGNTVASGPVSRHIVVPAGTTANLASTFSINPDCSFRAYNEIRIKEKPQHGTASVVHTKDFPNFASNNARAVCNGMKLPGTIAKYTPDDDFTGVDFLVMEVITNGGRVVEIRTAITVQ